MKFNSDARRVLGRGRFFVFVKSQQEACAELFDDPPGTDILFVEIS